MFLKNLLSNPGIVATIVDSIQSLRINGFFAVLYEIANQKNPAPDKIPTQLTEYYAIRAAYNDGYMDCIRDVMEFQTRYIIHEDTKPIVKATYNSKSVLAAFEDDLSNRPLDRMLNIPTNKKE